MEWKPIETAPKGVVLKDGMHNYGPRVLVWSNSFAEPMRARWWFATEEQSNFIADGGYAVFPSHWMPLPPPPEHV